MSYIIQWLRVLGSGSSLIPLSAIVSIWLTPLCPYFSICNHLMNIAFFSFFFYFAESTQWADSVIQSPDPSVCVSSCLFMTIQNTLLWMLWRPLVKGCIVNIGMQRDFFSFSFFNDIKFHLFGFLKNMGLNFFYPPTQFLLKFFFEFFFFF